MRSRKIACLLACVVAFGQTVGLLAAGHSGRVTLAGRAVPGAVVTVSQGERRFTTTTDVEGNYRLPDLPDGAWAVRVEMRGFTPITRDITVAADATPATWELSMLPAAEIAKDTVAAPALPPPSAAPAPGRPATPTPTPTADSQRSATAARAPAAAATSATPNSAALRTPATGNVVAAAPPPEEPRPADSSTGAADGFVIAGSVNNGASHTVRSVAALRQRHHTGAAALLHDADVHWQQLGAERHAVQHRGHPQQSGLQLVERQRPGAGTAADPRADQERTDVHGHVLADRQRQRQQSVRPHADHPGTEWRLFGQHDTDPRPADGRAVCEQHHSGGSHQRAGGGAASLLSSAERRSSGERQLSGGRCQHLARLQLHVLDRTQLQTAQPDHRHGQLQPQHQLQRFAVPIPQRHGVLELWRERHLYSPDQPVFQPASDPCLRARVE